MGKYETGRDLAGGWGGWEWRHDLELEWVGETWKNPDQVLRRTLNMEKRCRGTLGTLLTRERGATQWSQGATLTHGKGYDPTRELSPTIQETE